MYRGLLLGAGIIEVLLAGLLIAIGFYLPHPEAVEQGFGRVDTIARNAEKQVQMIRLQVDEVRGKDLQGIAGQFRTQTQIISSNVRASSINFDAIEAMSDALIATAQGLDGLSENLDPAHYRAAVDRLAVIADLLDRGEKTGRNKFTIDVRELMAATEATASIDFQRELLFILVRGAILETFAQAMRDDWMALPDKRLPALAAAFDKLIAQVNSLRQLGIPFLNSSIDGLQRIWREAMRIATEIRDEANRIWNTGSGRRDRNGRGAVDSTNPKPAAPLHVPQLPGVDKLIEPKQLERFADDFRKIQHDLDAALRNWPGLAATLRQSAIVLRESRQQMKTVLLQRTQYERAMRTSEQITQTADEVVQSYSIKLDARLGEQERSLAQMETGLHEASQSIPEVTRSMCDLLSALRWLAWLAGGLIGLHGIFVAGASYFKR